MENDQKNDQKSDTVLTDAALNENEADMSWTTRVKIFARKMLEKFSANVAPRDLQTQASQHHY